MKLGLGTAQFGLDYGVSNHEGQTSAEEVGRILAVAGKNGIRVIDTAALYGNSEEVVGRALPGDHPFKLVTKTVRINSDQITPDDALLLEQTFERSLGKLRCSRVYGLMIHNADDLLARDGYRLFDSLLRLKSARLVQKIGVSVYAARQVDEILARFPIDIIQLPLNVFDQRLLCSGHLAKLKSAGVEIHVRSAFLQGLLLMPPETIPEAFASVKPHLIKYHAYLLEQNITPVQAALGFVSSLQEIDAVICGVNNHQQLEELIQASEFLMDVDFSPFAFGDETILDPSQWRNA